MSDDADVELVAEEEVNDGAQDDSGVDDEGSLDSGEAHGVACSAGACSVSEHILCDYCGLHE